MRVLVTGADGQVGTELRTQAESHDFEIIASNKNKIDICDEINTSSKILKLMPDVIINVAAYTNVDLAEEEKELAIDVNFLGVLNLAKICQKHSILLIHLLNCELYPENSCPNVMGVAS